jgi:hypothetical protein
MMLARSVSAPSAGTVQFRSLLLLLLLDYFRLPWAVGDGVG